MFFDIDWIPNLSRYMMIREKEREEGCAFLGDIMRYFDSLSLFLLTLSLHIDLIPYCFCLLFLGTHVSSCG
jgi:hypothetical protein